MKLSRYFCLIFLAVFLALAASVPVAAKDKWISLRTKSFLIVSNGSSDDTRRLAFKLEQFRAIFAKLTKTENSSPVPITVVAFKNDGSFKPFKPLYNGKPSNVAGYFQRGEDENMIALDMGSGEEYPLHVIFHEYTHLLTAYNPRPWPLWLNEGIAEVYSTFDVKGKDVNFGKPVSNHVYLLRDSKFVPLRALFNVQHDSPVYNERDKQSIFYAESWALAHYLMFGDKSAHHDQLVQFVRLYEQGMDMDKAFTQAFKTDFATLEKTLRQYIGNNSYSGMSYTLESTEGDKDIVEQPLTDAEVQYYLGDLLLHTNRLDEAENFFKQAQTLDATLPGPHEGLGMVAMRRNQYDGAVAQFKEAIAHGSKNYLAHYYYGEAMLRRSMNAGRSSGLPADESKIITTELKTSISLMPSFAPAYNQLAFAQMMTGGDLKEALASSQAALRLEPQSLGFALILAQIQMRMQNYAAAKKTRLMFPLTAQSI